MAAVFERLGETALSFASATFKPRASPAVQECSHNRMALYLLMAQTLVLVAVLALLGQAMVGAFNWAKRRDNLLYRLFELIALPFVKLVRLISPKVVLDRHIPMAAFALLLVVYFWLGFEHRESCRAQLNQASCEKWAEAWSQQPPQ
jgi:hypothetical protein